MAGPSDRRSQHPLDVLIRELIANVRPATAKHAADIVERMANAPFPAVGSHITKRVAEGQWTNTSVAEYEHDVRRAVREPAARLVAYQRRGGPISAVLASSDAIIPAERRGPNWESLLVVVYSADRAILVTGYQAQGMQTLTIPEDHRWLK